MKPNKKLKEKFCKDYKIPIKLFDEPYFTDRLQMLNSSHNTIELWGMFLKTLDNYDNQEEFYRDYNTFKQSIIDRIKNNPKYKDFISFNMSDYAIPNYGIGNKGAFKPCHIGKRIVSIDLTKGNFSAMRHFSKELVNYCRNYDEFVDDLTDKDYFKKSKYIRQVVFGNCNPKRQVKIEKYMMNILFEVLRKYVDAFISFSDDEIIFQYQENVYDILPYIEAIANNNGFNVHYEIYNLERLGESDIYIKRFDDDSFELKGVNPIYYPVAFKMVSNQQITDNDLFFEYENKLCKFIEIPKF